MSKNDLDSILGLTADSDELSTQQSSILVSNVQPRLLSTPYRLVILGEAPGKDEIEQGKPFVGYSGRDLDRYLSRFGIIRDACFIGNICQHRPFKNQIANFDWDGPQIQSGLRQLSHDLANLPWRPNLVLLLGGSALHAFKEPLHTPRKRKTKDGMSFVFPNSISDWRGSFFLSHPSSPLPGVKCMAAFHPAACLRQYEWTPLLLMDVSRAAKEATFPELRLPQRTLKTDLSFHETISELDKILQSKCTIAADIEGYYNNISCISIATSPDYSFIIPFGTWNDFQESEILKKLAEIMANSKISKVFQNGLYDRFCLQYGMNMVVRGVCDDIMLKTWEHHCELPKSLAFQASLYTNEPYWKEERIQAEQMT